jgi:hypothetical protein
MKPKYTLIRLFLLLGILIPSISISQTKFQSATMGEIDAPLQKIMILHLGENFDTRKTLEGEIAYWLSKSKFSASQSYKYFNHQRIPTKENIIKALNENGFDGILTTAFITIESKERFENPQAAYNLTPNSPTFYNFLDSYQNKYSTGYTILENAFVIDTKLFKSGDETVIYQTTTETFQPQSLDQAIEDFSKSIAKDLKKSKLLEKQ